MIRHEAAHYSRNSKSFARTGQLCHSRLLSTLISYGIIIVDLLDAHAMYNRSRSRRLYSVEHILK